jgi:hypothetical protein
LPQTFYQLSNNFNGKSYSSAFRQTLSKTNNIFQSNDRYDSTNKQPWAESKFAEEGEPRFNPRHCVDGLAIGLQQYDPRQEKKVHFPIDVKSGPKQLEEDNQDIGGEEAPVPPQGYLWSHHAAPVPKSQAVCSAWNRTQVIHMHRIEQKHIFGNSTCYINTPGSPQQR